MGATDLSFAREEECFIVKETTAAGTLEKPGTDDRVYTVGPLDFNQDQEFKEDEQLRATASMLSPIKGRKMAGDWSGTLYVKPSGALGTAPEADVLFDCLMGGGAADAGVDYEYTLENTLSSFSFWSKKGDTVYAGRGATVNTASFTIPGDDVAKHVFGGQFMELLWAGTCKTVSIAGAVLTLDPGGTALYKPGMFVEVGSADNGGDGFEIISIHYEAGTMTIEADPGVVGVQTVTPWYPTAGAEVGKPVYGKMGIITVNGQDFVVLNATVEMNNNIKYYDYEKNDSWTAEKYGRPGRREITGTIEAHQLQRGASYRYRSEYQVQDALLIPAGKTSGYIMRLGIPYAEYMTPQLSGDEEFIQTITFKAIASASYNDEFVIVFM